MTDRSTNDIRLWSIKAYTYICLKLKMNYYLPNILAS